MSHGDTDNAGVSLRVRVLFGSRTLCLALREIVAPACPIEPCGILKRSLNRYMTVVEIVRILSVFVEDLYQLAVSFVEHRDAFGVTLIIFLEVG